MDWPKRHITWIDNRTLYVSVPFTWELPSVRTLLSQRSFDWDTAVIGGPAVYLMPGYINMPWVKIWDYHPGVLQSVNPMATRTTTGCIRQCSFCGAWRFEGPMKELDDWPDLPVVCDNNILAASQAHFDRVIDRLKRWGWADFNQGIDARLLTDYHAKRFTEIGKSVLRLALDSMDYADHWMKAFETLRCAGIAKSCIRSYALVGFDSDPAEAWGRCEWIESHGIKVLPMWFHTLKALRKNHVTKKQRELGWTDYERKRIMQWFYQHKKAVA